MKLKIFFIICISIIVFLVIIGYKFLPKKTESVHIHAGFLVYIDGVLQDFSGIQYMHIKPCNDNEHSQIHENDQEEKAHLHDNVGDVVHVHRKGAKWKDLFTNLHFTFPNNRPLTGHRNGRMVENIFETTIEPYDSIIIVVGETGVDLANIVSKEHIQEVEKKSENCGAS